MKVLPAPKLLFLVFIFLYVAETVLQAVMERGHVDAKVEIKITTTAVRGEGREKGEDNQEGRRTEQDVHDTEGKGSDGEEEEDKGERQEDNGDGDDDEDDEPPAVPLHPAGLKQGLLGMLIHMIIVVLIFSGAWLHTDQTIMTVTTIIDISCSFNFTTR